jgi:hypothetical protein
MRKVSPNEFFSIDPKNSRTPHAKSLFQNILAISPYSSRFCDGAPIPRDAKYRGMRMLGEIVKKKFAIYIRHNLVFT